MSRLASKAAPTELLNSCQERIAHAKRERIWLQLLEVARPLLAKMESLAEDQPETEDSRKRHASALEFLQRELKSNASQLNGKQKKMLAEWQQPWKLNPSINQSCEGGLSSMRIAKRYSDIHLDNTGRDFHVT